MLSLLYRPSLDLHHHGYALFFFISDVAYKLQSASRVTSRCRDSSLRPLLHSCPLENIRETPRQITYSDVFLISHGRDNVTLVNSLRCQFSVPTLVDINCEYLNSFCSSALAFFSIFFCHLWFKLISWITRCFRPCIAFFAFICESVISLVWREGKPHVETTLQLVPAKERKRHPFTLLAGV